MAGARPDAAAVRALAESSGAFSVTHEGRSAPLVVDAAQLSGGDWIELSINGLTFDVRGLAGGAAEVAPTTRHAFGLGDMLLGDVEAVTLAASPHLAGGEAMQPVVRSQMALAVRLAGLPGLVAVAWTPARSRMAVNYFVSMVSAWLEGGAFPALGLCAVSSAHDGGLQSEGLAFFTGQELRIEPELIEDRVQATKLAVRLLNELVVNDPVGERLEFLGPDGSPLALAPSANGQFVRVRAAE